MTSYVHKLCVLIAACSCAALSHAATPREDFESDKLLASAVAEIGTLNRDQLEAVIDYIAHCEPTPAPERNFQCQRAGRVQRIKTSRATALELIRLAVDLVDKLIPWNRAGISDETERRIDRRIQIFHALSRATAARYEALNAEGAPR